MTISERVAYLKGLIEGLGLDTETKEGKIISVIVDVLDDMALAIEDLEENDYDIGDELDALSADLADVEEIVYDDCDCDCDCDCCDDEEDDEDYMFSVTCPACGEELEVAEEIVEEGECVCPACGEKLEFEFDEDDEDEE